MNARKLIPIAFAGLIAIPMIGMPSIGCGKSISNNDAGPTDAGPSDAGPDDAGPSDAGPDGGSDAGFARTLITRPLMATSPQNLLKDPFVGGEATGNHFGQIAAFFNSDPPVLFVMSHTFQSVSPVGGAVVIEKVGDFTIPDGGTAISILGPVLGGAGAYHASIWISAGDAQGDPIPFASAASSIDVSLDPGGAAAVYPLSPSDAGPVTYGARQWMQFALTDDAALPIGGHLDVTLNDLTKTLQLAAPEVSNSLLGARVSGRPARSLPISASKARLLEQVRALPPDEPRPDRERYDQPRRRAQ